MVLIKSNIIWLYLSIFLSLYSCSEKIFTYGVDCGECYIVEPYLADITIHVTEGYDSTIIILYNGKVESGNIAEGRIVRYYPELFTDMEIGEYAAEAKYYKDGKTYTVIDGTEIKTKLVTEKCTDDCWVVTDNELDLRVKYQF